MIFDILRCWISRRIAGNASLALVLVDPDVIDSHGGWELQPRKIDIGPRVTHAQVHGQAHRFLAHSPLPNIAVGRQSTGIDSKSGIITNEPGYESTVGGIARRVFKAKFLVSLTVKPFRIGHSGGRYGLLVWTAAVRVWNGEFRIRNRHKIRVWAVEDVERSYLIRLRYNWEERCVIHSCFKDINFWSSATGSWIRVLLVGARAC